MTFGSVLENVFGGGNGGSLNPRYMLAKGNGMIDSIGASTRSFYNLQYIQAPAGSTLDLVNGDLKTTYTVQAGFGGTSAPSFSTAGKITIAATTTLWSFIILDGLSVWGQYEFATPITATTATVFDTSGNGRHLTITVADQAAMSAMCLSRRGTGGGDWLNLKGFSERENLLKSNLVGTSDVSLSSPGDGFYTLTKTTALSDKQVRFFRADNHSLAKSTTYIARCALLALPGKPGVADIGWYGSGWSGGSITKVSGPGTVSTPYTWKPSTVTGLSETEPTIIDVKKTNLTIGVSGADVWLYPGGAASTAVGDGCRVGLIQLCVGATVRPYTKVLSTEFTIQPVVTNGPPSLGNVVCMGDSLTASYPALMVGKFPQSTIINKSVGGQTSAQMLARFTSDVIDTGADLCLLFCGINDVQTSVASATTITNIQSMLNMADAANITVILATVSPFGLATTWTSARQILLDDINTFIRSAGLPYADMWNVFVDGATVNLKSAYAMADNLHFNVPGITLEADTFADVVRATYGSGGANALDVFGLPAINPGRAKYNLVAVSNPTDTTIVDAHTYSLPDCAEMRTASGWTGTANAFYNADGTVKTITGATLKANGAGPLLWFGDAKWVVFKDSASAKLALGV